MAKQWLLAGLGALFSRVPPMNIGCCGLSACSAPVSKTGKKRKVYPMKKFAKKQLITIIGIVVGVVAGFCYWKFIGCSTGSCAITSNPVNSTLYGAVTGGLLFSIFKKQKNV